jgi:hypothetical protein
MGPNPPEPHWAAPDRRAGAATVVLGGLWHNSSRRSSGRETSKAPTRGGGQALLGGASAPRYQASKETGRGSKYLIAVVLYFRLGLLGLRPISFCQQGPAPSRRITSPLLFDLPFAGQDRFCGTFEGRGVSVREDSDADEADGHRAFSKQALSPVGKS